MSVCVCRQAHNVIPSFFSLSRSFPAAAGALFFIRVEPPPPPTSIHTATAAAVTFSDHVEASASRRNRNVYRERIKIREFGLERKKRERQLLVFAFVMYKNMIVRNMYDALIENCDFCSCDSKVKIVYLLCYKGVKGHLVHEN